MGNKVTGWSLWLGLWAFILVLMCLHCVVVSLRAKPEYRALFLPICHPWSSVCVCVCVCSHSNRSGLSFIASPSPSSSLGLFSYRACTQPFGYFKHTKAYSLVVCEFGGFENVLHDVDVRAIHIVYRRYDVVKTS